ncbi:MAG: FMN-binding negative transcriptional regulator [Boseongicola sp.]|nr:FMN-binding negative transcriptional regulator [Boseongicola sp.]MDD9979381.1 FMN-binding negative transcriptional regulator [Boseongicola sp.]
MYAQEAFREDRVDVLSDAIRDIRFAALVSTTSEGMFASHVPMEFRQDGESVYLQTHLARPNPHWRALGDGADTIAIFQGPQSYITPSWYASKKEHGKVVPTWAYIAVHAHGSARTVEDDSWLLRHLNAMTNANEISQSEPWKVDDAPERFIGSLSRGIVGVEMKVSRLEGSWKINQNKSEGDVAGTYEGLLQAGEDGRALAQALQERLLTE